MFNEELVTGITDTLGNLNERVGELERKETLTVGDGAGPFRYELHVSQDGRGTFETIGAACDYVAAQANVGSVEWIIYVHPGFYIEDVITVPEFTTIEGIGGDVFVRHSSIFLGSSFFTTGDFVTFRNLRISQGLSSDTEDAFVIDAGDGLTLDRCTITARWQGIGQGDINPTGAVRAVGGGHRFFGCELLATNQTDAEWFVVYINSIDADDSPSFIRSCRIWLDPEGLYFENGTSIYFDGPDEELYLLETTILGRDAGDPGNDIIAAGVGATIWLRATNYNKGIGTINYMYAAGAASVSSVDVGVPGYMTSAGGPITSSGTIELGFAEQDANLFFASPDGASGEPTFRAIEVDDVPLLPPSKIDGNIVIGTGTEDRIMAWGADNTAGDLASLYTADSAVGSYNKVFVQRGEALLGGQVTITELYDGFEDQTQAIVEISSSSVAGIGTHYAALVLSAENSAYVGPDAVTGTIIFADRYRNTTFPDDLRSAAITAISDATYGPRLQFSVAKTNAVLTSAMEIIANRAVWIGHTFGATALTGAGDLDVAGNCNVDGNVSIGGNLSVSGLFSATVDTLDTDMGAGNTLRLRAYDVDGATYVTFLTLTANNVPTANLRADVTIDGIAIARGTGANTQVAYWTGANELGGDSGMTYTAASDLFSVGKAFVGGGTATGNTTLELRAATGSNVTFELRDEDFSGNPFGGLFTPPVNDDTIGRLSPFIGGGGLVFNGFASGASPNIEPPLTFAGYSITSGTVSVPAILLIGWKYSGAGTARSALGSTEIVLQIQNTFSSSYTTIGALMTVYGNGNVGLGTQPAQRLDISETTGAVFRIRRNDTGLDSGDSIGKIEFHGNDTQLTTQNIFANIEAQAAQNITTDAAAGNLLFRTTGATAGGSPVTRLTLTHDGRIYGSALHNNAGAVTGTANQYIASGTYTPTLTHVLNVAASTAFVCQWLRVGNVVTVSGKVSIDPTSASTSTQLGISLPIASALTQNEQCSGVAYSSNVAGYGAAILGDATNDRAHLQYINGTDVANQPYYFTFTYEVL